MPQSPPSESYKPRNYASNLPKCPNGHFTYSMKGGSWCIECGLWLGKETGKWEDLKK